MPEPRNQREGIPFDEEISFANVGRGANPAGGQAPAPSPSARQLASLPARRRLHPVSARQCARSRADRPEELLLSLRGIRGGAQKTPRLGEDPTPQHGKAQDPAPGPDVEPGSGLRLTGGD